MNSGESTRSYYGRCAWLASAVTVVLLTGLAARAAEIVSIEALLAKPDEWDGKTVEIEGEVTEVFYRPMVRNGVTLYSFRFVDGTGEMTVRDPMAAVFSAGDEVRVTATFRSPSMDSEEPELDASSGQIRDLNEGQAPPNPWEGLDLEAQAVPVATVATRWSRTVDVAAVVSAVFAAVAALSILLRRRRFNLRLATLSGSGHWSPLEGDLVQLSLSVGVVSTGAATPWLREGMTLRVGSLARDAERVAVVDEESLRFPYAVEGAKTLRLDFHLPREAMLAHRPRLTLADAFSGKRFRLRVSARNITVDEALSEPQRLPAGGTGDESSEEKALSQAQRVRSQDAVVSLGSEPEGPRPRAGNDGGPRPPD